MEEIIPEPLCCKMTGELMKEPCLIETGDCYEKEIIQEWIKSGKLYDPFSKEELKHSKLILCQNMKAAIEDFKKKLSQTQRNFLSKAHEISLEKTLEILRTKVKGSTFNEIPLKRIVPPDSLIENQFKEKVNVEKKTNGNLANLKKLLANGYIDAKNEHGNTILHINCDEGDYKAVNFLMTIDDIPINSKNKYGITPLHYAVMRDNIEITKLLLINGARIDDKDNSKRTALFYSCTYGNFDMIELLIDSGANVLCKDIHGVTVLHLASRNGNKFIVEYLISKGAKVNAKDNKGFSPLDYALNNDKK